jgi:hypothetical protein
LAFVLTLLFFFLSGETVVDLEFTPPVLLSSAVVVALFTVVIVSSREVHAVGDATREPLNPRRVQAAQALALLVALLSAWSAGVSGGVPLLPLWAALIGVGLYRLAILIQSRTG